MQAFSVCPHPPKLFHGVVPDGYVLPVVVSAGPAFGGGVTKHRNPAPAARWFAGRPPSGTIPLTRAKLRQMAWGFEKIFIVRHGETEWNLEGRRQGQLDSPLTEAGRSSAGQIAALLSELDPDALFSSPLGRAYSTAQIIDAVLDLGISSEVGLSEIDHGELAGLTDDEIEESRPGLLAERRACLYTWRFPDGESYADGDLRAAAALRRVETTFTRRPVLVTHEMIARMLVRNLLELTADEALNRSFRQDTVYQVIPPNDILAMA